MILYRGTFVEKLIEHSLVYKPLTYYDIKKCCLSDQKESFKSGKIFEAFCKDLKDSESII